jgi:uncharacterized protein
MSGSRRSRPKSGRRTTGRRGQSARTARPRKGGTAGGSAPEHELALPGREAPEAEPAPAEAVAADDRAARPVIGYQRWHEILFLHWPVPAEALRPLVDERLELDLFDGRAYVSLTPFTMRDARVRPLPRLPFLAHFHELNLRTYVRGAGVAGLWFLSLDAASAPATVLARATLGLPYFRARIERFASGPAHEYRTERLRPWGPPATFAARWSVGAAIPDPPGSLDRFLAERYALYSKLAGRLVRVRVRHAPWSLQEASVERLEETVTRAAGVDVRAPPALARFSGGVDVEVQAPELV